MQVGEVVFVMEKIYYTLHHKDIEYVYQVMMLKIYI